jgi:hypothetical protein
VDVRLVRWRPGEEEGESIMAYRIKGIYTKKERVSLAEFVRSYYALVDSPKVDEVTKQMVKVVSWPLVLLAQGALHLDNVKIFEKACGSP